MMIQQAFAYKAKEILEPDDNVIGLAIAGSWLTNEIDDFSDLDLVLVTRQRVSDNKNIMLDYAKRLGNFLSGFTGEHVGEPRLLICLYADPLLHVDIKFLTIDEFKVRIENPTLLIDKDKQLEKVISQTVEKFPHPDYQWIEDRFWTWLHYALLKIGRGEYFEAHDFMAFLRAVVFGPLLHIKNDNLPRGVRKVELDLPSADLEKLKLTLSMYDRKSLLDSLRNGVLLYRQLRRDLFDDGVILHNETDKKVMSYFEEIERQR